MSILPRGLTVMLTHRFCLVIPSLSFPTPLYQSFGSCSDLSKVALREVVNRQLAGPTIELDDIIVSVESDGGHRTSTAYIHADTMRKAESMVGAMHNNPFGGRQLQAGYTL